MPQTLHELEVAEHIGYHRVRPRADASLDHTRRVAVAPSLTISHTISHTIYIHTCC